MAECLFVLGVLLSKFREDVFCRGRDSRLFTGRGRAFASLTDSWVAGQSVVDFGLGKLSQHGICFVEESFQIGERARRGDFLCPHGGMATLEQRRDCLVVTERIEGSETTGIRCRHVHRIT